MNSRRNRLLSAATAPVLEPAERIEVATIVNLRSVSVRRSEINSSFVMSEPGSDQGLKLIFPLISRKDRNVIAATACGRLDAGTQRRRTGDIVTCTDEAAGESRLPAGARPSTSSQSVVSCSVTVVSLLWRVVR